MPPPPAKLPENSSDSGLKDEISKLKAENTRLREENDKLRKGLTVSDTVKEAK